MADWLDHPAAQAAVAPFVTALAVASLLRRTRHAWLAIVAGYAAMVALTTGFSFSPLSASRRILLLCLAVPFAGLAADLWFPRSRGAAAFLAALAGAAAAWTFLGVLVQKEGGEAWVAGLLLALFAMAMVASLVPLRDDALRAAAAGIGLGVGAGVAAVVSASIGFLFAGAAVAAASAALLLVFAVSSRAAAPGLLGALTLGMMIALFAEGALMLAQLPWYAAAALLLVPVAVRLPVRASAAPIVRAGLHTLCALAAAGVPVAAAWFAASAFPS